MDTSAARAKLKARMGKTRTGGKGSVRRKKKAVHKTTTTDEKRLTATLKRLNALLAIGEADMGFPFRASSKHAYTGPGAGMRAFGARRSGGSRAHAAADGALRFDLTGDSGGGAALEHIQLQPLGAESHRRQDDDHVRHITHPMGPHQTPRWDPA